MAVVPVSEMLEQLQHMTCLNTGAELLSLGFCSWSSLCNFGFCMWVTRNVEYYPTFWQTLKLPSWQLWLALKHLAHSDPDGNSFFPLQSGQFALEESFVAIIWTCLELTVIKCTLYMILCLYCIVRAIYWYKPQKQKLYLSHNASSDHSV
jgi:hypothetical protein